MSKLKWYDGTAWRPAGGHNPASGAAPFDPWSASYPTPLQAVWAGDPDWTDPGDGNLVTSWRNESGDGDPAQATSSKQPTYRASTVAYNDRPTVQFGGDDVLVFNVGNTAQPIVLVAVANTSGANGVAERIMSPLEQSGRGIGDQATNAWAYDFSGSAVTGGTSDADPHVFVVVANGASSEMFVDGASVASGSAGTEGIFWFYLGGVGTTPNQPLTGHIAYAAMYSKSSRDADIQALESALADHYGITLA